MSNTQRLTISLPDYLYQQLQTYAPKRGVSRFVADAVEEKVIQAKTSDPIEEFIALKNTLNLPRKSFKQIKAAIAKGRT